MLKPLALAAALASLSATATAAPVTYPLDPAHTNVVATWNHLGFSNPGAHFGDVEGTLVYDAENVAASSAVATFASSATSWKPPMPVIALASKRIARE